MRVKVGALYMGGTNAKAFATRAEEVGFDSLWVGDHLLHYVDATTVIGCFAAVTERVTLGTNVVVIPFRAPAVIAKAMLTTQWMSGRETILGAGVGGDVPTELDMVGMDRSVRGRYTDEALDVIRKLWTEEDVSYEGRWNRFSGATMQPRVQRTPDIWVGGRSEGALRRAIRYGNGYLPYLVSPGQVAYRNQRIRQIAVEQERDLSSFIFAATTFLVLADTHAEAVATASTGFRNVDTTNIARYYALGSLAECLERLTEYLKVGVTHLVIGCAMRSDEGVDNFMSACRELIPELKARGSRAPEHLASEFARKEDPGWI